MVLGFMKVKLDGSLSFVIVLSFMMEGLWVRLILGILIFCVVFVLGRVGEVGGVGLVVKLEVGVSVKVSSVMSEERSFMVEE